MNLVQKIMQRRPRSTKSRPRAPGKTGYSQPRFESPHTSASSVPLLAWRSGHVAFATETKGEASGYQSGVNCNTIVDLLDGGSVLRSRSPELGHVLVSHDAMPVEAVSCTQTPNGLGLAQGGVDFQHSEKACRAGRRRNCIYCYVRWWCLRARAGGASTSKSSAERGLYKGNLKYQGRFIHMLA